MPYRILTAVAAGILAVSLTACSVTSTDTVIPSTSAPDSTGTTMVDPVESDTYDISQDPGRYGPEFYTAQGLTEVCAMAVDSLVVTIAVSFDNAVDWGDDVLSSVVEGTRSSIFDGLSGLENFCTEDGPSAAYSGTIVGMQRASGDIAEVQSAYLQAFTDAVCDEATNAGITLTSQAASACDQVAGTRALFDLE